ncbi:hypothetical protein GH714_008943 [Hevea brasiliensis]|uniref:Uncharacterized protein n=1 Tax=Hevea brasiliensis TaxID=3981 RepID=A0A6A6KCR2_HEVBR|nr:hypothetical protein GH714_008943 [Hevea brasiliensis]
MAAPLPLFLMEQTQGPSKIHIESGSSKTEPTRNRGSKPSKGPPARKKQPQRGMGVAQLERLRCQEMKTTGTNQLESCNLQPANSLLPDLINSVPIQYGSVSYGVPMFSGGRFLAFDQGLLVKQIENGGIAELNGSPGLGQFLVNPYVFGAPDMRVRVGTTAAVFETSKELSSMPKMMQHYEHTPSDVCVKKKRFNGENIGYHNGRREKFAEISAINGSDFLGLNLENQIDLNDQMGGFSARAARSAFDANHNLSEGVELVAIHRKGNTTGGTVFMEYEFFPGEKSGKSSTCSKEMEFPAEASVAVVEGGEASCVTTSDYSGSSSASNAASNSVDLSLKLSC